MVLLLALWTFVLNTCTIAHGLQSHHVHLKTGNIKLKTKWYVKCNICTILFPLISFLVVAPSVCLIQICFYIQNSQRMTSPAVERRCAYSPMPERGRTAVQHRPERREKNQEQACENKENITVQERDADKFLVPLSQTPGSSKKNTRPNKNVLTTPTDNVCGTKTHVSPRGKTYGEVRSHSIFRC